MHIIYNSYSKKVAKNLMMADIRRNMQFSIANKHHNLAIHS